MRRFNVTKNSFITMLFMAMTIILMFVIAIPFIQRTVQAKSDVYTIHSLNNNADVDFVIPGPSDEQITNLGSRTDINTVTPFYRFLYDYGNQNTFETSIFLLDDPNDIASTPYNDMRIIEGNNNLSNGAVIDYEFHLVSGLKMNDTVQITLGNPSETLTYKVIGISEENLTVPTPSLIIHMDNPFYNAITTVPSYTDGIPYAGAYLNSNDIPATWQFLSSDYQPLATLKPRSDYNSDQDYQDYLDRFNDKDYAAMIYHTEQAIDDEQQRLDDLNSRIDQALFVGSIILLLLFVVSNLIRQYLTLKHTKTRVFERGTSVKKMLINETLILIIQIIVLLLAFEWYRRQAIFALEQYMPYTTFDTNLMIYSAILGLSVPFIVFFRRIIIGGFKKRQHRRSTHKNQ